MVMLGFCSDCHKKVKPKAFAGLPCRLRLISSFKSAAKPWIWRRIPPHSTEPASFSWQLAALSWSTSGLFVRMISADLMTTLFLRGLFSGTAVFIVHCILEKRFRHL